MKDYFKYFDKLNFAVLIVISLLGIFLIYSASHGLETSYHTRQMLWLLASVIAFFIASRMKTDFVFKWSYGLYVFLVVVLVLQYFGGIIVSGTRSWLRFGVFSVQVSEFIKIPMTLIFARRLAKVDVIEAREFVKLLLIFAVPFALIALQPDLGTAFVLSAVLLGTVLLKRIRLYIVVFSLVLAIAGSAVAWNYVLKPYQKDRIKSFLNPEKYSKSIGYQIIQSKIAIGSGGLKGKGYLRGSQSQYRFLPTRHTDFIISVLGEEFGFLGLSLLFLLFFILFHRQFNFKPRSDEEFYFAYLFNGLILFQFLINILMSIGLIPILGLPLPFVSYGGSSLLAFYVGEALIFRVKINNYLYEA
jgi:rod shape determining protein RodA